MRIMVKGGVWKNTEDEILKAAVMKYGKNQWARIASLLSRKTAKQCKQRWYEWLDPSIKKTEWSREEEEKLLHLAKIMPNQWKTIAPLIGRTASQCLDHYEKLLDSAQNREGYDPEDDPRRLRPGEIDPTPESKPARPDPIDMDEDEKEMLSEARARLANTKGKKAKRKAREKQLEEARRLAALQKRRELKAAGIEVPKHRRKIKGIDYNKEIPFQRQPPKGPFEVPEEEKQKKVEFNFKQVSLDQLEPKRKRDDEEELKREDQKRQRIREQKNLPEVIARINQLNDPLQLSQRGKLMLPEPSLDDKSLAQIAKLEGGEDEQELLSELAEGGSSATRVLLPSYKATPARTPSGMRTPQTPMPARTPMREDRIAKEVQNLIALSSTSTPLIGGENPELHPTDFSAATPKRQELRTPNLLASTPARGSSVASTPFRRDMSEDVAEAASIRSKLREGLRNLPAPENEYNIVLPDLPEEQEEELHDKRKDLEEEDASEVLARKMREQKEEEERKLRMRSEVLKRELPRPVKLFPSFTDFKAKHSNPLIAEAEDLIRKEMVVLITHDAMEYPFKGNAINNFVDFESFSEDELKAAKELVQSETQMSVSQEEFDKAWEECVNEMVLIPDQLKYVRSSAATKKDKLTALQHEFSTAKSQLEREDNRANKLAAKVNRYCAGYMQKVNVTAQQIINTVQSIEDKSIELECFKALRKLEERAIPNRLDNIKKLVRDQEQREAELQMKYHNLLLEKQALQAAAQ